MEPTPFRKLAVIATLSGSLVFAGMTVSQAGIKPTSAKPGHWTTLGLSQTAAPELWAGPDNRGWLVWSSDKNGIYHLAIVQAAGGVAGKPSTIIKGWSGVSATPTLLPQGKKPLLVFAGQKGSGALGQGCTVGALPASPQWTIQSWSLTSNCVFSNVGYGDASESKSGVLSAAWAGGPGAEYRIGISPTIPATGADKGIPTPLADTEFLAEANDQSGNGHFWAAFDRFFSKSPGKDGVYAKDLTANKAPVKAPGSGTEGVNVSNQRVAMAAVSRKGGGVYLAYCSNTGTCNKALLWKVGAKKALAIPSSKQAVGLAMSAGPGGRLWLAWYNEAANRVLVVRTNRADTRFGPVKSYPVPCFADGNTHVALSGGSFGRVDVGLECLSSKQTKPTAFVTQSLTGLSISASPGKITNTHATKVTFTVTDAGDRVAGAKVQVAGKTLHTGNTGTVTVTFAKHARTGSYKATASAGDYFNGSTTVHVSS